MWILLLVTDMQAQQSHQKKWEQYWKVEVKISAKKKKSHAPVPCHTF